MTTDSTDVQAITFYLSPQGNDAWSGDIPEANSDGTDGPFATLPRAQQAVRALKAEGPLVTPVHVLLRGGVYRLEAPLTFIPDDAGAPAPLGEWNNILGPERSVTYAAYPGERAEISGGERLTRWRETTHGGQRAWVTTIPAVREGHWYFTQLWVNGRRAARPRLPKDGLFQIEEAIGVVNNGSVAEILFTGQDTFRYREGELQCWQNLTDVEMVALHYWIESRIPFREIDTAQRLATLQWKSRMRLTDDFLPTGAAFYVENVSEALDTHGEWYLDRPTGTLTYLPLPDETLAEADIVAPRLPQLLQIVGEEGQEVGHLVFENLIFSHSEWVPGEERHTAQPQAACHLPGAIVLTRAHVCRLEGCTIAHIGSYGLEINAASADITVSRCTITDIAGGIKVWHADRTELLGGVAAEAQPCRRIIISDNEIGDGGHRFHQAVGVLVGKCTGVQVVHNHIHHFDYTGISVGWTWGYVEGQAYGNIIEYNHLHHIGQSMLSDMGAIYLLGVSPGTRVRYNIVHDVVSRGYGGMGIYTDEGSSDILIENNLVYRTKSAGYQHHYGARNLVRNNIFAFSREAQIARGRGEAHVGFTFTRNIVFFDNDGLVVTGNGYPPNAVEGGIDYDYNLYFNRSGAPLRYDETSPKDWHGKYGQDRHSLIADPLFVDADGGDFTLRADSPAFALGFVPFDLSTVGPRTF